MSEEREESYKDVLDEEVLENAEGTVLSNTFVAQVAREAATRESNEVEIADKTSEKISKELENEKLNKKTQDEPEIND